MDGWPDYWPGLPPHVVRHPLRQPLFGDFGQTRRCCQLPRLRTSSRRTHRKYGSPFAGKTAAFTIRDSGVCAEVTRSLFDTARQYRESFDVFGSKKSFEWQEIEGEEPVIHTRGKPEPEIPKRVPVPDYAHLLPEPIQRFTTKGVYCTHDEQHLSFTQRGGHGGSHPHLVHAFLSAIRSDRPALPDAETSANWTMVGLCAYESTLKKGATVTIPRF